MHTCTRNSFQHTSTGCLTSQGCRGHIQGRTACLLLLGHLPRAFTLLCRCAVATTGFDPWLSKPCQGCCRWSHTGRFVKYNMRRCTKGNVWSVWKWSHYIIYGCLVACKSCPQMSKVLFPSSKRSTCEEIWWSVFSCFNKILVIDGYPTLLARLSHAAYNISLIGLLQQAKVREKLVQLC